jgi:hypothetical protein
MWRCGTGALVPTRTSLFWAKPRNIEGREPFLLSLATSLPSIVGHSREIFADVFDRCSHQRLRALYPLLPASVHKSSRLIHYSRLMNYLYILPRLRGELVFRCSVAVTRIGRTPEMKTSYISRRCMVMNLQ